MHTAITIDARSATPIHRQIYEAWRRSILSGRFRGGERIPSTRELATVLSVARSTVSQAYEQLLAEGYLQAVRGSGTFVSSELPDDLLHPIAPARAAAPAEMPIRLSAWGERLLEDHRYPPSLPQFISFSRWLPDFEHFPHTLWRRLLTRALRKSGSAAFDYARQSQGLEALRGEIAAYLARSRALRCTAEQIVIVNGSQQALDLCARLLLETGDEIAFENPGYPGTRRIFAAYGARLRPGRVDSEGLVVDELSAQARVVCVTPSHQFPTGAAMSLSRRLELISWARAHGAVIVEDDYDSEYRYSGPPLPSLQGLADAARVVYCGTFSKVMFPGLRVGYIVLPQQLAAPFARAKWIADRHTAVLEQLALADFLSEGHLDRHIRRMRQIYGRRRQALVEALARHFGAGVEISGDAAGMHLMARFDDQDLAARAQQRKVQLASTEPFYLTPAPAGEFIFGFSTLSERAIREGVRRLAR